MKIWQLLSRNAWSSSAVSRDIRYRERFEFALALSLLVHALILALRFGAAGFGFPWGEETIPAPPVTLKISESLRSIEPSAPTAPQPTASAPARPSPPQNVARAVTSLEVRLVPASPPPAPPAPPANPRRVTRAATAAAKVRARDRNVKAKPAPRIIAQAKPRADTFKVPSAKRTEPEPQRAPERAAKPQADEPRVTEPTETAKRESDDAVKPEAEEAARRAEEQARQRAVAAQKELEAKKLAEAKAQADEDRRIAAEKAQADEERRVAAKKAQAEEERRLAAEKARNEAEELARQKAVALKKEEEAKKLDEARRVEEKKQEEARLQAELKKQEEGRRIRVEMEALKRAEEMARLQAEAKKKELEAKRVADEAAKAKEAQRLAEEAGRKEAERKRAEAEAGAKREGALAGQKPPGAAPGQLSGLDLAAKAIDSLRNPELPRGDQRKPGPPTTAADPRRRSVFGIERDVMLRAYVDSWRWKLERYGTYNYRRSAARASIYENPVVTVAIRSDGTLEEVRIHRSSGLREIDEAVRRIAELHAPYSKFPPALARQYDVIEIRRIWAFEDTLKIMEEM